MNPQNNWRRIGGVVMVATLALFAGACSSDDDSKSTTTTTAKGDKTTESTVKPMSNEEFSATVAETSAAITAAGTDLCAVSSAVVGLGADLTPPANSEQSKDAVSLYVVLLNSLAGLPAESPASSEALRNAAIALPAEAEAAGYPADFLSGGTETKSLSGAEIATAFDEFQQAATAQCAPAAPTDPAADPSASTVPAG